MCISSVGNIAAGSSMNAVSTAQVSQAPSATVVNVGPAATVELSSRK